MLNFLLASSFSIFIFNFVFELTFSISEIEHDDANQVGEGNSMGKKKKNDRERLVMSNQQESKSELKFVYSKIIYWAPIMWVGKNMEQRLQL